MIVLDDITAQTDYRNGIVEIVVEGEYSQAVPFSPINRVCSLARSLAISVAEMGIQMK